MKRGRFMSTKTLMFTKNYSNIKNLQTKSTTTYYLVTLDNLCSVEIHYSTGDTFIKKSSKYKIDDKILTKQIITFLFENSIPIENFDDIIVGLISQAQSNIKAV